MNWRSYPLATVFLGLSVSVHAAMVGFIAQDEPIEIEGGAPSSTARLGNSFQDMAAGVLTGDEGVEVPPEEPVELAAEPPLETVRSESPLPVEPVPQPVAAQPTPAAQPAPVPIQKSTLAETPVAATEPITAPALTTTIEAVTPESAIVPLAVEPVAPTALQTLAPKAATPVAQSAPETIKALPDQPPEVVQLSARPKLRPKSIEAKAPKPAPRKTAQAKPKAQAKAAKPKPQPKGNSKTTALRGSDDGQTKAKAQVAAKRSASAAGAGNAAVSNYPGLVMRKLSRQRRPRVSSKGTALIAFKIAANGGLASVQLARSSGSAQLDAAALALVRKAGPFPKPPAGARRGYQVSIKGR